MSVDDIDAPHPIDAHVGGRIRLRRLQLGLSQSALALRLGVSFQAVQKYESGDIRISASRLYETAQVLLAAPGYFFEEYAMGTDPIAAGDPTRQRELLALIRGYFGIRDAQVQAEILRLVTRLGVTKIEADANDVLTG
ncbi:MAG TPA: helix-turn-helix domain-containing protein [Stellaceae bacterium]|nr:helix-turn-helix domain-containing protein [Stellaceae bacterium]